ncbi:MAG: NAD(P)H-binding protein [Bacteroidales bacterium]|jgi:uncharacterized protein YbjT (DUF2867 family)|nr:NAD(P)H-binding protein [Bacteroidales bacterium]MCU0408259.1 NAD(P)H-binding protein [Bacteroidales bacterium]
MDSRTALVFGASGLVGRCIISELLASDRYSRVRAFVRKTEGFAENEKLTVIKTDFGNLNDCSEQISGDDLFIALGTTIKKAGSVSAMEEIDRDLPVRIASMASANRVSRLSVVSSTGADAGSRNYYLRIKGEMEQSIMKLNFKTVAIMRPSLLLGERDEKRFGENAGKVLMKIFGIFLTGSFRKFRAIEAHDVARAMIKLLSERSGKEFFESDEIQKIADTY